MNSIISQYRITPNSELELRFKFTRESFEVLFNKLAAVPNVNSSLECSLNIITRNVFERKKDSAQYIRRMIFVDGVQGANEYWRKDRLANMKISDYINYTVSLSTETPIEKFASRDDSLIRVKTRVSFSGGAVDDDNVAIPAGWRVDMTATRAGEFKEMISSLPGIRDKMFPKGLSVENFFGSNLDHATHYEVEIEHIGGDKDISSDDPNKIASWLFSIINPQWLHQAAYQDEVYRLAKVIAADPTIFQPPSKAGLKRLSNQVKSINKNTYYSEVFPPVGYYLTEKTDGQRCIGTAEGNICKLVSGSGLTVHSKKSGGDGDGDDEPVRNSADDWAVVAESIAADLAEVAIVGAAAPAAEKPADAKLTTANKSAAAPALPADASRIDDAAADWVVVDGELVTDSGLPQPTYFIFDVMIFAGHSLTQLPFSERQKFIEPAAKIFAKFMEARAKKFEVLAKATLENQIRAVYETKYPYTIDGLIMTEPTQSYLATVNYKWKPLINNTIDFLAVKAPSNMVGRPPYMVPPGIKGDVYLLFSGIRTQLQRQLGIGFVPHYRQLFGIHGHRGETPPAYIPIQFCPSANPHAFIYVYSGSEDIDRKVIELRRNETNTAWIFVRVRSDRSLEKIDYGNDFVIAEQTYMNYIDPFELADLWRPSLGYFTKVAPAAHTAPNRYKRFVIGGLLQQLDLPKGAYVIDEAAGRGADLARYQAIEARNVLFIDIDTAAIAELIVRKFEYFRRRNQQRGNANRQRNFNREDRNRRQWRGGENEDKMEGHDSPPTFENAAPALTVHTLVWDLKKTAELAAATSKFGARPASANLIVCNFAFHYMCDTLANMRQLLKWNAMMLQPGGFFMFTVLDGKSVFDLLRPVRRGESWSVEESGRVKYQLTKKYPGVTLAPAGQTIGVLMSFADEPIDEPLCNVDTVIAEAAKFGFALVRRESFGAHYAEFASHNATMASTLTADDKQYIDLYHYVVLRLDGIVGSGGRRSKK